MAQLRPTFSESWYRVADLKVRLRPSAQMSRQFYRGERWYVVRDPAGNQFHRLSAPAYAFVALLDGTRTVAEAWELTGGQLADSAPTQNEVIQILSQLHSANLVEANVTPDAAVLLRRHKRMVQRQWKGRLMNVLFPRIPLWDPDEFLKRWMPAMKPLLSWWGLALWFVVVISAVIALVPEWDKLKGGVQMAMDPSYWPWLWLTFVGVKLVHELGHAFACRRFGGECHELGVMFLVLVPAPYVDASSAWLFPSKWARAFVGAAGMVFELFVAGLMAFVWLNTQEGTLLHYLAFNTMLIASVSTILFNANPLLRYDGYYILSDLLEIPNLRYRSPEYSLGLIKRHLFKVKLTQPLPPVGQRVWLLLYAISSSIYRTFIGFMIILIVWDKVPMIGILMAIGGAITWLCVPVFKTLKYLLIEPELHRKRMRAAMWTVGAIATVVVVVGLLRFSVTYTAEGYVDAANKVVLHAGAPGVVETIVARDGQALKQGDVILVCSNLELDAEIARLNARLSALRARYEQGIVRDRAEAQATLEQIADLENELKLDKERRDRLTLRSPIDGVLIAPDLDHLIGRYITEREEVAIVSDPSELLVRVSLPQDDAALRYTEGSASPETLARGQQAKIRLASMGWQDSELVGFIEERTAPQWMLPHASLGHMGGGPSQIDPTDTKGVKLLKPQIEVYVRVPNPDGKLITGQRAYLRFDLGQRKPLIWNWSRRLWQIFQSQGHAQWL